ncbi:ABC transporter ATP-binding protein [Sulfurovum sp.]|uniref:cell division ATP-binding protein FtsE n=1 Tax=Sulfurovum sp. TaxID=1969726 RepID=UPI002A35B985|nr:ABC transporter ATP-binding protein [Sulfurovum sp.]MDD2451949.1 ABC transporter ATP-binding protein [Sulfurovum sp.]MDD3500545.1 ABC transporter ATP-binding protein [Sulfurovum sp.]MDY0402544.1 ABC transporter ATP-binding protein [Sulfurovum sp.]
MSNVINASNLTLTYDHGRKEVITDVNFTVKKGEFVFITGPSGSGKSTLLKSLYGRIKPTSGNLVVGGVDLAHVKPSKLQELRTHMGIIFQDFKLVNEWTVAKNVVLPLMIAGYSLDVQNTQAHRLLKHVKLSEHAEKYPLELSGGEQQRVGVARALAKNPVLILADEPTGNLDDYSSNVIWDLMENACQQLETTVLVVTHKIPQVFSLPYRHFIIEGKGVYEVH